MKKQQFTTPQERKLKFAEAGILFTLVLALTVFVGAKLASRGDADVAPETAAVTEIAPAAAEPAVSIEPVETVEAVAETPVEPEPAIVEDVPVTYARAEETFFSGDYAEAASLFDRYTREHADNAWGHYMLGLSEWKAGDADAAEEAFLAALELNPEHVKSLVNYSRVLLVLERPDEAAVQIAAATALEPDNLDARRVSARVNHARGDLDAAADEYLSVLTMREDDAWSLNNLGLIRIQQERFDEALPALARAAQLSPATAVIQNNLGVALERTGHPGASALAYAAALAADDAHPTAEASLARVESVEPTDAAEFDLAAVAASFSAVPGTVSGDSLTVALPAEFGGPVELAATDGDDPYDEQP